MAQMTLLPKTTVHWHVPESLTFGDKKLRWVPQGLSEEQKRMPVEKSSELLQTLISLKHHSWRYIVALDESRLHLSRDYQSIWLPSGDTAPEREKDDQFDKNDADYRLESLRISCYRRSSKRI
jgi:hypothetical protein